MASITKKDNGKWLARVSFRDVATKKFKTKSSSFRTKIQASEWARKVELEKTIPIYQSKTLVSMTTMFGGQKHIEKITFLTDRSKDTTVSVKSSKKTFTIRH